MNLLKWFLGYLTGEHFAFYISSGGGTTQSTGTTYNTNIPEYAGPYVNTMLGATQKQLFEGNTDEGGNFNITGFKPYQAYSSNPADYVAGFSPMQQQAQRSVAGMQVPGEYGAARDVTGQGIMGAFGTAGQAGMLGQQAAMAGQNYAGQATNPYSMGAYMSPYMQNVVDVQQREAIRQSNIQDVANKAQATQAGAFGGSRQAIVDAERQRNLATQLGGIQAQGLQSAFQNAQQAQQFGANLGLQGYQTGLQGVNAQQAAYNQMLQGANQYANLGSQTMQAQQNIANLQNTYGAQQQALEQQKINQAIQDYANAQQYPLMQLGTMSNMLRGLPMQAQTTQQYVAAPNTVTQAIGTAGSLGSLYNAFNPPQSSGSNYNYGSSGRAAGGEIKEMASGGIASVPSYDVGGEVEDTLENMPVEELKKQAETSSSPTVRAMAKRLLAAKQMQQAEAAKGIGPMGVQYQAPGMAGGGIIAFAEGKKVEDEEAEAAAQLKSDREAVRKGIAAAGAGLKDAAARATAAGADVLTMVPRGVAGAVDTAVMRPLRALGADVGYISPNLTPGDQASDTATPFYDRYIRAREEKDAAPAAAPAPAPAPARAGSPAGPRESPAIKFPSAATQMRLSAAGRSISMGEDVSARPAPAPAALPAGLDQVPKAPAAAPAPAAAVDPSAAVRA